jgi:hypothetical protein
MGIIMNARNGLVACCITLLVTAGVAACGSSGGGSSSLTGSSLPSWAKSLGSGVEVIPPGSTSPDNNTPADVLTGLVDAIKAKNYKGVCQFYEPSQQSSCASTMSEATTAELGTAFQSFTTIKPTYTVIDGTEALVGATGTVCDPSTNKCSTNNDPTAILDSGKPFSQLWQTAVNSTSDAYEPVPVVKVNGKWYGDSSAS